MYRRKRDQGQFGCQLTGAKLLGPLDLLKFRSIEYIIITQKEIIIFKGCNTQGDNGDDG